MTAVRVLVWSLFSAVVLACLLALGAHVLAPGAAAAARARAQGFEWTWAGLQEFVRGEDFPPVACGVLTLVALVYLYGGSVFGWGSGPDSRTLAGAGAQSAAFANMMLAGSRAVGGAGAGVGSYRARAAASSHKKCIFMAALLSSRMAAHRFGVRPSEIFRRQETQRLPAHARQ